LTFTIDGDMLIGQACRKAEGRTWHAMNPATGAHLEPAYANSELSDVD
jgi:hypothetical protein